MPERREPESDTVDTAEVKAAGHHDDAEATADAGPRVDEDGEREGLTQGLRKALASGIRTVLSADEVIRSGMPKEALGYIMKQTDAAKDEVVRITGVQIRKFLENLDLGGELQKILTSVSFEIRTEVRFVPNKQGVTPNAKVRLRVAEDDEHDGDEPPSPWRRRFGTAVERAFSAFQRELGIDEADDEFDDAPAEQSQPEAEPEDPSESDA